jgi:OOP family OmpA-OmpF porin
VIPCRHDIIGGTGIARRRTARLSRAAAAVFVFFLGWLGTEQSASAQVTLFDIRRFAPPTDPQGSLVLEPVTTAGHLQWTAGFLESYAHRLLVLKDGSGHEVAVPVRDQLSFDAMFNVGIGERLALGLRIPALMGQTGDAFAGSGWRVPRSALGDLAFDAKATLIPRGSLGGVGLAAIARMTVPTGDANSTVATRGVTGELRMLGEIDWIITALRASAGVMVRSDRQVLLGDTYGQELPWAVGLLVRPRALGLDSQGRWQWFVESSGAVAVTPSFASRRGSPASLGLAARYAFAQDFSALGGVQLPLDSAVGVPSVRFVFGISWAPRFADADGDGIRDDADDCPELAEDFDGVEDDDGCPEDN